jgi:catechol 2,3-dioxygenase-like lactoylglutathione lyase family enzyme
MASVRQFPEIYNVVIDTPDPATLADFYRQLLGFEWHPKVGPPPPDDDWVVIVEPGTGRRIAFQQVPELARSTWPEGAVPAQIHFDLRVGTEDELQRQHERALGLGATVLFEQVENPDEELIRVYADPVGHPFCIFVRADGA